jgi:hypothetical protein
VNGVLSWATAERFMAQAKIRTLSPSESDDICVCLLQLSILVFGPPVRPTSRLLAKVEVHMESKIRDRYPKSQRY